MVIVDRRFFFVYKDGDKLYPQLYASAEDETKWVFHVSPARNALGHGKEAKDLKELKYYVLELGWRMRARSDDGRNGSYARYAGGVKSDGENNNAHHPIYPRQSHAGERRQPEPPRKRLGQGVG